MWKILSRWALLGAALAVLATPTVATAQVTGGGNWYTATPTNGSGAFWDNLSADATPSGDSDACNVGFWAVGTFDLFNCRNYFGSPTGFVAGDFWGATGGSTAPDFMFKGGYQYNVSLVGTVFGGASDEIGWFYYNGGYVFNPLTGFESDGSGSGIGLTATIYSAYDWGFYIKKASVTSGCDTNTGCSDAWGAWAYSPYQQWSLFRSASLGKYGYYDYLSGAEDNKVEYDLTPGAPAPYYDADYNDYIIQVSVTPEPASMALVATGLVGLLGAGYIRRRKESGDPK